MRGSDPDATLYWLAKMIHAGEDPRFIARRIVIHAAEDVGLADPMALVLANAAFQAAEFIGWPEARIPLAEAAIYIATANKSNSTVMAIDAALKDVESGATGGFSWRCPALGRRNRCSSIGVHARENLGLLTRVHTRRKIPHVGRSGTGRRDLGPEREPPDVPRQPAQQQRGAFFLAGWPAHGGRRDRGRDRRFGSHLRSPVLPDFGGRGRLRSRQPDHRCGPAHGRDADACRRPDGRRTLEAQIGWGSFPAGPAFSPDGKAIIIERGGVLRFFDADSGASSLATPMHTRAM